MPHPRINLANERLTQRHINSLLLGAYLKEGGVVASREQMTVEEFFLLPDVSSSAAARFDGWVSRRRATLIAPVRKVVDATCELTVERALQLWCPNARPGLGRLGRETRCL